MPKSFEPEARMKPTTPVPLVLSDYEVTPEQGFLPRDPQEHLPDCSTLNQLGHDLPKLLSARMVRRFIDEKRTLLPFFNICAKNRSRVKAIYSIKLCAPKAPNTFPE